MAAEFDLGDAQGDATPSGGALSQAAAGIEAQSAQAMRAVADASALRAQVDDAATRLDAGLAQASSSLSRLEALEKERQATHDAEALAAGGAASCLSLIHI